MNLFVCFLVICLECLSWSGVAATLKSTALDAQELQSLSGFFRFSFEAPVHMPSNIPSMGLLNLSYFADITPSFYAGFGGYGALTGNQGGLFTLGLGAGVHHEFLPHWWGDLNLFVGGGGGRSSLTGGGLMIQPQAGVAYALPWGSLGVYYSDLRFPNGEIHSQQVGVNLDLPFDIAYLEAHDEEIGTTLFDLDSIRVPLHQFIGFEHNDFALLAQAYVQKKGTRNTTEQVQDGTIGLVGAEFDHYCSDALFWWLKMDGAFHGIPNGYMDVLGGLGYHAPLGRTDLALVSQMGLGAGGGGLVNSGGGFLVHPVLGLEWALSPRYAARVSSGYLWAPGGTLRAVPLTVDLIAHLDVAHKTEHPVEALHALYTIQGWRLQAFQQTYTRPQRSYASIVSAIQLIGIQIDQIFTPWFFMSYQGTGAYIGDHAGGYATGMIGPGVQSRRYGDDRVQFFALVLLGAGGGGGLALNGGAIIEPQVGARYMLTKTLSLQASVGDLKALNHDLHTPVLNFGVSVHFDTLMRRDNA